MTEVDTTVLTLVGVHVHAQASFKTTGCHVSVALVQAVLASALLSVQSSPTARFQIVRLDQKTLAVLAFSIISRWQLGSPVAINL